MSLSEQRDTAAARRFFVRALMNGPAPVEVTTDKAGPYLRVLDDLVPAALRVTEEYTNNRVEADHGRLKARLRRMRGLKRLRSASVIAAGMRSCRTPECRCSRSPAGRRPSAYTMSFGPAPGLIGMHPLPPWSPTAEEPA